MTPYTVTATFAPPDLEAKAAVTPSGTSAPDPWLIDLLGGTITAAKVRVNPQSAMRVPAVKRAVDLISNTISVLPSRVLRLGADGSETPATDHPAHPLVARRANPWTGAALLRGQLVRDTLLHGDGFALVNRVRGKIREILHLPPGSVTVEIDEASREPAYKITTDGVTAVHDWRDVIHVQAPSIDGITGLSPIHAGREAIGLALVLEVHAARLFGNGARPGGVIAVPGKLGSTAAASVKGSWQAAFGGDGSGGTAVLEDGARFEPITLNSVDAQFIEQRRHQVREIANIFSVPATMLNDLSSATFSNAESLAQAFRDECLLPIIHSLEFALERALLDEEELSAFRIAIDTDALDRADLAAKSEALAKRRAAGITSANEERRALNLPARPDGDALSSPYTTPGTAPKPEEAGAE